MICGTFTEDNSTAVHFHAWVLCHGGGVTSLLTLSNGSETMATTFDRVGVATDLPRKKRERQAVASPEWNDGSLHG